jgi:ComF family protein
MAQIMYERLPKLEGEWFVVAVPSATGRVRERSFDHSKLLAQKFAEMYGCKCIDAVGRLGQSRQVGAKRLDRLNQLAHAFWVTSPATIKGKNIIVVDDVITTGASVSAVASILKKAGAKKVVAMSFAHKKLG